MTDDDKGGSGSGTGGSADAGADGAKNKTVKMTMDQAYAEIENYKRITGDKNALTSLVGNKDAVTVITDLVAQLDEVNKILEGQEKGRLIGEILPRSSYKIDELVGKTPEELKSIRATLDQAMPPRVNSVRFGVRGADLSDREKGLTVGDLSIVTAQKRKEAA